jgi:hypothetical protein
MLAVLPHLERNRKPLARSLAERRSMAEKSPSMIFINQGGRIVYVNSVQPDDGHKPASSCPNIPL